MPPQPAEGERDAHGGRQPTRENTFRVLGTHHSFEDAEALINTLLTVDTFILGFALTFLGLFSYDDLLRMDLRFATIWKDGYDPSIVNAGSLGQRETLGKHVFLPSAPVAFRGYYSVGFLAISLSTSLGLYVSMALSTLREDTEFFELWFSYAKYGIIVSFTGLFVGLFYFFGMVATVVIGMYPKCTMLARLHEPAPPRHRARALTTRPHYTADCDVFKGGYESYWAPVDAVYNATSNAMIQGCVSESSLNPSGNAMMAINILFGSVFVLILAVSVGGERVRIAQRKRRLPGAYA